MEALVADEVIMPDENLADAFIPMDHRNGALKQPPAVDRQLRDFQPQIGDQKQNKKEEKQRISEIFKADGH